MTIRSSAGCCWTRCTALPLAFMALAATFPVAAVCLPDGTQASGSIYRICMPPPDKYNGDLVIWAHGFQDAGTPVQIPEDLLVINGVSIPDMVNAPVRQGMADILDLIDIYTAQHGKPRRVYLPVLPRVG